MTHPAKFLCGHLAHGYEKCNGCVAEARTREIVEWLHEYVLGVCDEQAKEDLELCRDKLIEKFMPKAKP